jgi:hypothetical protein
LNLASALIRQVIALEDFETWSGLRKHYLPPEYHVLYGVIEKHCENYHKMPSFEDLKFDIRDTPTQEKLFAIEALEVDAEPFMLLQYLKNEYTQKEILLSLEKFVDKSVAFETAEESVTHLHQIVLDIGEKVELELPTESMQRINLFETEDELGKYLSLGLNRDYDYETKFSPRDLVLIGGRRGAGKSVAGTNIASNIYDSGRSAIYFTIEMDSRLILQRICAISTGVPVTRIRARNLSIQEWEKVATWWANRFQEGQKKLKEYRTHRDFDRLHLELTTKDILIEEAKIDVVYDPSLTIAKIKAELDKKIKSKMNVGAVIVDYINQVRRSATSYRHGQYDWTEQIEVSKALKGMAQEYETTIISPYQIDASGEARFAKGILDAADAAFTIEPYEDVDACMTFKCVKMRSGRAISFTSAMDWETLKIGPESALTPKERKEESGSKTGESIEDI